MSLARYPVLLLIALPLASCQKSDHSQPQQPTQQVSAKPSDEQIAREKLEKKVATLRALDTELSADLEGKRKHLDELMRTGQEEKAIKTALDDYGNSQEQLLKIKKRLMEFEQKLHEADNSPRATRSEAEDADNEVATIRALTTELTMDLDGKKALYDAQMNAESRRDYLEAMDQLEKVKLRLAQAEMEQQERDKQYWAQRGR